MTLLERRLSCWGFKLVMFVAGVMNLTWIIARLSDSAREFGRPGTPRGKILFGSLEEAGR